MEEVGLALLALLTAPVPRRGKVRSPFSKIARQACILLVESASWSSKAYSSGSLSCMTSLSALGFLVSTVGLRASVSGLGELGQDPSQKPLPMRTLKLPPHGTLSPDVEGSALPSNMLVSVPQLGVPQLPP